MLGFCIFKIQVVFLSMPSSLHDDLQPVILPRAHTENLDSTLESDAEKVAHHKVGRFDVGIKKEVSRLDSSTCAWELSTGVFFLYISVCKNAIEQI